MAEIKTPKKLIEVALPLDKINEAAATEKSIRHGHPSTLHLWWARRPLAAARAVIFAQMVNDPSWKWELEHPGEVPPGHLKAGWAKSRRRLFSILEELVRWENTTNEEVLDRARAEIRKSWRETCELNGDHPDAAALFNPERLPSFHDPFAGGGALPLEAQRLGLESFASDLNPVAVLINKAMIEIPPSFAGRRPVGPRPADVESAGLGIEQAWPGVTGLAEDVRYYAAWMRSEAERRIGYLYPKVTVTAEMAATRPDLKKYAGQELTVIAWLWARTVRSPNPAFTHIEVPLASTFMLSTKPGKETYVEPVVENGGYRFTIRTGTPADPALVKNGTKLSRGANFRCVMSGTPIASEHIYSEARAGRLGARLMAVAAEGVRERVYLPPTGIMEDIAHEAKPEWRPEVEMPANPRWFSPPLYGLRTYGELFTLRQLVALTTFADLVQEAREKVKRDAIAAGMTDDGVALAVGGVGATAYADAVGVYLGCGISRSADFWSSLCIWANQPKNELVTHLFGRQAIPMAWDFAEANPFSESGGNFAKNLEYVAKGIEYLPATGKGLAFQADAAGGGGAPCMIVSTDPPYYDNIGYADLSDYFYVWLRRSQRAAFPDLFATIAVPKAEELVATPYRHGGKEQAEAFFLQGMTRAMHNLAERAHPAFPTTIYYAFKQSEDEDEAGTASTGWETFLDAVIRAGYAITGTWPMRTERQGRMIGNGTNALASSIVLVCRPRAPNASVTTRREFQRELSAVLPQALDDMVRGANGWGSPVAPVDLSQAIIGPGMAIFSKYAAVLEADGSAMSVRTALQLINRFLAEDDFDADTQFCLHWFEQHGWREGRFGDANTLAQAKGTSVDGLRDAGVVEAEGGAVRLLKWAEYPTDWDVASDPRLPVWEALHHLIRVFRTQGEGAAGQVMAAVAAKAPAMRQLAYRLYPLCERAGWAEDARAYNEISTSWDAIDAAASVGPSEQQGALFDA